MLNDGHKTEIKKCLMKWCAAQVEMWERITAALATLGPSALALGEDSLTGAAASELQPEQLVEYEGMLVSANAAQRRRWNISPVAAFIHSCQGSGSLAPASSAACLAVFARPIEPGWFCCGLRNCMSE